jgi:hypothetical protein
LGSALLSPACGIHRRTRRVWAAPGVVRPGQAAAVHVCLTPAAPHNEDAADQLVPRRREARVSWINPALVESTVKIDTRDDRRGSCVVVDTVGVPSSHGYFSARQDRSGHAERKDSGDDDCSPDAHGSSTANAQVNRSARHPGATVRSPGLLSPSGYFMHVCNRNLFFFKNASLATIAAASVRARFASPCTERLAYPCTARFFATCMTQYRSNKTLNYYQKMLRR